MTYYWLAYWANAAYTTKGESTSGTAKSATITYGTWLAGSAIFGGPFPNKDSIYAQ